jgi:hypothetical protein
MARVSRWFEELASGRVRFAGLLGDTAFPHACGVVLAFAIDTCRWAQDLFPAGSVDASMVWSLPTQ